MVRAGSWLRCGRPVSRSHQSARNLRPAGCWTFLIGFIVGGVIGLGLWIALVILLVLAAM